MDKNWNEQVRVQQYQEAANALMNEILREIEKREKDTSPDALPKLVDSVAEKLKRFYSKWGKEGLSSLLFALAKDYFRPELPVYYILYYVPLNTIIESSSRLIEENKDNDNFWRAIAMAVLQHGLIQMAINDAVVFDLSETQQAAEDVDIEDILD